MERFKEYKSYIDFGEQLREKVELYIDFGEKYQINEQQLQKCYTIIDWLRW